MTDDDQHLIETGVEFTTAYRGSFFDVRKDTVRLPDGSAATREYIKHPGAAVIVPILSDNRLVLERQYRYPVGRVMLEFPAGKLDPGEDSLVCAARELAEETGYRAKQWARAGILHNAIAYSNEGIEIWFARDLTEGPSGLDEGEFLEVTTATEAELDAMAQRGDLTDAKTLISLLWLKQWRAGLWTLDWRSAP